MRTLNAMLESLAPGGIVQGFRVATFQKTRELARLGIVQDQKKERERYVNFTLCHE